MGDTETNGTPKPLSIDDMLITNSETLKKTIADLDATLMKALEAHDRKTYAEAYRTLRTYFEMTRCLPEDDEIRNKIGDLVDTYTRPI